MTRITLWWPLVLYLFTFSFGLDPQLPHVVPAKQTAHPGWRDLLPGNQTRPLAPKQCLTSASDTHAVESALEAGDGPIGEFSTQRAIVVVWRDEDNDACRVQLEIVRHICRKVDVLVVVSPKLDLADVIQLFRDEHIPLERIAFPRIHCDTMWVRDYGPMLTRRQLNTAVLIDPVYDEFNRSFDDIFPKALATQLAIAWEESPLAIEGGNVLSNGEGLLVTTSKTMAANQELGFTNKETTARMLKSWNAREFVVVEPLDGEPTGHIDMFVTFVDADTVVVGRLDPKIDAANSRLLDAAAIQLSCCRTSRGPLRVERIPMPALHDDIDWPSYTNVVYANGVLLIPAYQDQDASWREAHDVFKRLLPDWTIVGIDCTKIVSLGGALHCLTLNVPQADPLAIPRPLPPRAGVRLQTESFQLAP